MDTDLRLQSIELDRAAEAAQLQRVAQARALWAIDPPERLSSRQHLARAFALVRLPVVAGPNAARSTLRGGSDVRRPY